VRSMTASAWALVLGDACGGDHHRNLLDNAAQVLTARGRCQRALSMSGDVAVLKVQDEGIGIRPEEWIDCLRLQPRVTLTACPAPARPLPGQ